MSTEPNEAASEQPTGSEPPVSELEQLRKEVADSRDRLLRSHAELENYRKRSRRDFEDQLQYAALPLVRDLLPVMDNMQRAIEAGQKNADVTSLLDGVKLVQQSLQTVLARHHCERIEALHQPFDPAVHEAIVQQPSAEFPPNTVLLVAQDGYKLFDRVVRAAQVIVSTEASS